MNKKDDYLINYDEVMSWKIKDVKSNLNKIEGLPLSDCTISKLVFYKDKKNKDNPILTGNGVYIFKDKDEIKYVGKCSSRSFVERIPAHLDVKNTCWFNSYLKRLVKKDKKNQIKSWFTKNDPKINDDKVALLKEQAKKLLKNDKLILINFKQSNYSKDDIRKLEILLNEILIKNNNIIDKAQTVAEYIDKV